MRRSRVAAASVATALAAVLVGGVVAGGYDWSRRSTELSSALDEAKPTKVADIPASDGMGARGVFAQITSTGEFCLSDAPLDAPLTGGGGCNPADDPLGASALSASLAYDGGPAIESVRDARLIGLAAVKVAAVRVLMSDGSSRTVKLKKANIGPGSLQAFGYRIRKSDLKKGIGPVAVLAVDESGTEVARQETGIG
jgi:hypothetical protein